MILEAVLLAAAVLCALCSAVGVLVVDNVYDRLHYLSGTGALGIFFAAAAVWTRLGVSEPAFKALLIAIIIFFTNGVLTHATGRAAWVREHGRWDPLARGVERLPPDGASAKD